MGKAISECAKNNNAIITGACDVGDNPAQFIEEVDVIIDFSFYKTTS